jgi:hypothetical protein
MVGMATVPLVAAQSAIVSATPRIGWVDRLDQPETAGMRRVDGQGVARVIAIHGKRRDQQRTVDTDGVHRSHHVVTRDLGRTMQKTNPGPARVIAFIRVNLGIDCEHDVPSPD